MCRIIRTFISMKVFRTLLAAALLIAACAPDYSEQINGIEQIVSEHPREALDSIRLLEKDFPSMSAKDKAYYSLIYAMALDKSYIDTTDTSILEPALKYYSKHGTPRQKMLTYYYLGRIYGNAGQYDQSITTLMQALEQEWDDDAYRGRAYAAMFVAHAENYNVMEEARCADSAAFYYQQAGDSALVRVARYYQASSSLALGEHAKARLLLDQILQHEDLEYHLKANCLKQDAYVTALLDDDSRFQQALEQYIEAYGMGCDFSDVYGASYAYLLYQTGEKETAAIMLNHLDSLGGHSRAVAGNWRSRICEHEGDIDCAFQLLEKSLVYQDSVVIAKLSQSLVATQRDYYADKALREQQYAELLKSRLAVLLLSIAVVILILVGVVIMLRRREINKVSQYESILEEVKNELFNETQTGNASRQEVVNLREQFRRVYKHHFDLLAKFYEDYDIQRRKGIPEEQRNQQILKIIDGLRGDDESGNRFEAVVNEDMNGIIDQFRQDYPSFSEQDYRLFCYYVAGFSTKTISIIVHDLSADAIYMRKSRMKKHILESECPRRETYLEYL